MSEQFDTDLKITNSLSIPYQELQFSFSRSSGPGGQNVNKVNTKATLKWNVIGSPLLTDLQKSRLLQLHKRRVNSDGDVVIASDRHRDQRQNRQECMRKLRDIVLESITIPKSRKATRPTRSSQQRRLQQKKAHSDKKQSRRFRPPAD